MIAEERLKIITDLVAKNIELTRANLISEGLSDNDIRALKQIEILMSVGRGCYQLNNNYKTDTEMNTDTNNADEDLLNITFENNDLQNIICYLENSDYENAFKAIYSYLDFLNKANFKPLIINLVKICLLENDSNFTQVIDTLKLIYENKLVFNLADYIIYFYSALASDNLDKAKIYFDIICKSENYGGRKCFLINEIRNIFNVNKPSNYKINDCIEKVDTLIKKIENTGYASDIDFNDLVLEKRYFLQRENGIVLLPPMNDNDIDSILAIAAKFGDIRSYSIQTDDGMQVVLEYKERLNENINYDQTINAARKAKNKSDYTSCIGLLKRIIQVYETPSTIVYAKIGLAYRDCGDFEQAITYLTVATALSKQEGTNFDYSNIINELENKLN